MTTSQNIRRHLFLLASPLLVILLVTGWFAWNRSSSPICSANLDRIRPGMHRSEVETILGGPRGDYRDDEATTHDHSESALVFPRGQERKIKRAHVERWFGEEFLIVVSFDEADRVKLAYGCPPLRKPWYHDLDQWLVWGR